MMNKNMMMDNELDNVSGGAANGSLYYRVAAGDTLGDIAKKYGTTVARLQTLNPDIKNADLIYAGQYIRIS